MKWIEVYSHFEEKIAHSGLSEKARNHLKKVSLNGILTNVLLEGLDRTYLIEISAEEDFEKIKMEYQSHHDEYIYHHPNGIIFDDLVGCYGARNRQDQELVLDYYKALFGSAESQHIIKNEMAKKESWETIYSKYQMKFTLSGLNEECVEFIRRISQRGKLIHYRKDPWDNPAIILSLDERRIEFEYQNYTGISWVIEDFTRSHAETFFGTKTDNDRKLSVSFLEEILEGQESFGY